ncbi:MAG TPA: hypothetical protein DCY91_09825 [Cyanobacteria bacterium UBA11370]|nr:hypothetical protein [Cyanobacteria bacterium UBA11370]HBY80112.1 hypothetical protein [Cyanobacteria bacterium UBA11148]
MKLSILKQKVYHAWECLSTYNSALVQSENFKSDVRYYGDLRRKKTWEKALVAFIAQNMFDSNLDNYNLILWQFNFTPDRWDYEFRNQILEEFLALPGGLDCLVNGLEQIFQSNDIEDKEKASGLLTRVVKKSGTARKFSVEMVSLVKF